MLDTALDFSNDICGHIDVLLSMFILKNAFYPCYHHNDVDSEITAYFLYVLTCVLS